MFQPQNVADFVDGQTFDDIVNRVAEPVPIIQVINAISLPQTQRRFAILAAVQLQHLVETDGKKLNVPWFRRTNETGLRHGLNIAQPGNQARLEFRLIDFE